MGHKKVCFNCRKAFSLGTDLSVSHSSTCPECGKQTSRINHAFRPPSKDDLKKWEVAEYLKNHGFIYQHIYSMRTGNVYCLVDYPETIAEAKEFVIKYKSQAYDMVK